MTCVDDLEAAKAELARWQERSANDSSNNPNKHRSSIRSAQDRVDALTKALKASGDLLRSPQELLDSRLDAAFPNSRSRRIVLFEGRRYQRRYSPARMSISRKSVVRWNMWWEDLDSVNATIDEPATSGSKGGATPTQRI